MTWALRPGAVSAAERGGGWPLPGCAGLGGALGVPAAPRQGDRQDGDVSTPRGKGEAVKRAAGTGSLRKPPAPLFSPRSPRFSPHSTEHSRGERGTAAATSGSGWASAVVLPCAAGTVLG